MKTQEGTVENKKKGTKKGQHRGTPYGKDNVLYWKERLRKRTGRNGAIIRSWQVRIKAQGRELWFNLHTENRETGADKARNIYRFLMGNGWEETLRKYKPKSQKSERVATVGELIATARKYSSARESTFGSYERALRTIASEIAEIKATKDRYNHRGTGNQEWKEKVDAISLDKLDTGAVTGWRNDRISKSGKDPIKVRKATATADSLLRCAKSLFGKKILPHIQKQITLPTEVPLSSAKWKMTVRRFRPSVTPEALTVAAKSGLEEQPEAYKALILCLYLGLRKAEADCLTWKQINFKTGVVSIRETKYFRPKTEESIREIHLPDSILEVVSAMRKGANTTFVLKGGEPRPGGRYAYYRADVHPHRTWTKLATWLRKQGVDSPKPIHDLRKMAGSLIYAAHGLEVARDFLGHNDISTTANSYVNKKPRVIVEISPSDDPSTAALKNEAIQ